MAKNSRIPTPHRVGPGHFWAFPAATCGTDSRHLSVIGGMLLYFRIVIPSDHRHRMSKLQGLATNIGRSTYFFDV
jgi:hypothetical protein